MYLRASLPLPERITVEERPAPQAKLRVYCIRSTTTLDRFPQSREGIIVILPPIDVLESAFRTDGIICPYAADLQVDLRWPPPTDGVIYNDIGFHFEFIIIDWVLGRKRTR